jgi:hypothetical protein
MAQFWLQLAQHAEERGERAAGSTASAVRKPDRSTDNDSSAPSS